VPIAGLAVIQLLQNIDLIAAKHRFSPDLASSYAATAVAAKVLIWVAMGAGFYLVPECSRRRAQGKDTRLVLLKTLAIIGVCAVVIIISIGRGASANVTQRLQGLGTNMLTISPGGKMQCCSIHIKDCSNVSYEYGSNTSRSPGPQRRVSI